MFRDGVAHAARVQQPLCLHHLAALVAAHVHAGAPCRHREERAADIVVTVGQRNTELAVGQRLDAAARALDSDSNTTVINSKQGCGVSGSAV